MASKITWNLIEVKTDQLKPNPNNPKLRDKKGFARLKKSLDKFGKVFDGLANKDLTLIDGHSRLEINENKTVNIPIWVAVSSVVLGGALFLVSCKSCKK